jgi:hypothetical protein
VTLALTGCEKLRALPGFEPAPAMPQPETPPVAMGPWLLEPAAGGVTVAWITQRPSVGRVWYGTREPDRLAGETGAPVVEHRVVLGSLQPSTRYRYRVEGGAEAWFESAPRPGGEGPIRVLVYGDNRGNGGDHALVARAAASERAQLLLHTGGMVLAPGDEPLWRAWFEEERDLLAHAPILAAGDGAADAGGAFARYFQRRGMAAYRSLDYGPVHICLLDSSDGAANAQEGGISQAQRAWLEEDLRGVPRERHVWVLVHQGPFAHPLRKRPGRGEGAEAVKAAVQAAARVHPIEAVFAGNEHFYERGTIENIAYFVLGAGGAPPEAPDASAAGVQAAAGALSYAVVAVCGCHTSFAVKDIAGRVLDSLKLSDCATPCAAEEALPVVAAPPPPAAIERADAGPSNADRGASRHSRRRRPSMMGLDGGAAPAENQPR